jgi:hypothetical protein
VKTQAYCDLTKLEDRVKAVQQNTDPKTVETFIKQAEALIDKLGPEYFKLMDGLERVDPNSSEAKDFCPYFQSLIRAALSKAFRGRARTEISGQISHYLSFTVFPSSHLFIMRRA